MNQPTETNIKIYVIPFMWQAWRNRNRQYLTSGQTQLAVEFLFNIYIVDF